MATIGGLAVVLRLNTAQFTSGLNNAASAVTGFGLAINNISGQLAGVFAGAGLIQQSISLAAGIEQIGISFEVLIGDAEKARKTLGLLQQFANVTPFAQDKVIDAGKRLLAMGITVDQLIPTLNTLGNVSAASGKDLSELSTIFGQVKIAGRLTGQDLMQFTNAGIPLISELAKSLKQPESAIKEMVEAGKIGFGDVARALDALGGTSGRWGTMMERQSQTLAGRWSTFVDGFKIKLMEFGQAISTAIDLKGVLAQLTEWVSAWQSARDTALSVFEGIGIGLGYVKDALQIAGGYITEYLLVPLVKVFEFLTQKLAKGFQLLGENLPDVTGGAQLRDAGAALQQFSRLVGEGSKEMSELAGESMRVELGKSAATVREYFAGIRKDSGKAVMQTVTDVLNAMKGKIAGFGDAGAKPLAVELHSTPAAIRGSREALSLITKSEQGNRQERLQMQTNQLLKEIAMKVSPILVAGI